MQIYGFLLNHLKPKNAAAIAGLVYAALMFLIFLGLSAEGGDLRYANL